MRYFETSQITISDDTSNQPQSVRFSEAISDTDITALHKLIDRTDAWPVGNNSVNLGSITSGKFLFIKPAADIGLSINGGTSFTLPANKTSKLWATITSLNIVVPNTPQNISTPPQVTVVVGG